MGQEHPGEIAKKPSHCKVACPGEKGAKYQGSTFMRARGKRETEEIGGGNEMKSYRKLCGELSSQMTRHLGTKDS